jgi:Helix-turn-helix domain
MTAEKPVIAPQKGTTDTADYQPPPRGGHYENVLLAVLFSTFGFVFFDRLALNFLTPRLDGARADLTSPHMAEHRIADIASRWAFASQAHFTRAFRARFGCTPTQVRQT